MEHAEAVSALTWTELLNQELFLLWRTPVTPLTIVVILGFAFLAAASVPLISRRMSRSDVLSADTTLMGGRRFGTFQGVFTPSILTILGVVMYLRLGWVVGHLGLGGAVAVIVLSHLITLATGLSVASISTNRTVGAGGAYFMISRSLGAPAGAAIGLPLFFSQALSVTFYIVGFTESLTSLVPWASERLVGTAVCMGLMLISLRNAALALKLQYYIMAAIGLSLASFFSGRPAVSPEEVHWWVAPGSDFAHVFAAFFPAVTGIMAGVSMSGDLKDPRRSLPKGTLAAIGVGFVVYLGFAIWLALNATRPNLMDNTTIVWSIARFPTLIYVGVWGATLSSALGSLLTAPRTLQALASDRIVPRVFTRGYGPNQEPALGTVATFLLAEVGILLGSLDVVAPVLTMFFLATYGVMNLACGLERWAASPSFRPTFVVPAWVSLGGAIACFYAMSLINMPAMVVALLLSGAIYVYAQRRLLGTTYGDARHGIWSALVRSALIRLRDVEFHPLNWRPNLVILGGDHERRPYLLELGSAIVQDRGLVTYYHLLAGDVEQKAEQRPQVQQLLDAEVARTFPNVFCRVDVVDDLYRGIVSVAQSYGMGSFEANTVLLGWPNRADSALQERYGRMLRDLANLGRSVLITAYDPTRKFGKRQQIDIWWGGLQSNGGLMLLLAYLITADNLWRNARVRIITVVRNERDRSPAKEKLSRLIRDARLEAEPLVQLQDGRPIDKMMREISSTADLAIVGVTVPPLGVGAEVFFRRVQRLLNSLPSTLLVHSARHFRGEPVLFESRDDAAPLPVGEVANEKGSQGSPPAAVEGERTDA